MKDFYYILGTASNATPPEIDAAYQKLARKFLQDEPEQDDFIDTHLREITEAYDVLRDTNRRRKYDIAFRRNQKRHLAAFKLKYLNIALTITFLVITALFADYVINAIHGRTAKKIAAKAVVQPLPAPVVHPKKHHKVTPAITHNHQKPADTANLRKITPTTTRPAPPAPRKPDSTYTTTLHANITGIVYLHQSADYNSAVLAKIPDSAWVRVLQKGPAYYKIRFKGQSGYVLKSSVTGQ